MKIGNLELKSIKVLESMSEETICYSANIYWKGKKIGSVSNRGCGGCDDQYRDQKEIEAWLELEQYVNEQPKEKSKILGEEFEYTVNLEFLCSKIITDFLKKKDFKKMCKSWSFFVGEWNGSYSTIKKSTSYDRKDIENHLKNEYPNSKITMINDLSFDDFKALAELAEI